MLGPLAEKFGHLRGADVEPTAKSIERFYKLYGKPVAFLFRTPLNEILFRTHLDVVNARFEPNLIYSLGFFSLYDVFFQGLDEVTRTELFVALVTALKFDPSQVKADSDSVLNWAAGKTEADVVAAFQGQDSSAVGSALARIHNPESFRYTRNLGAGLIKLMQLVGVEPNSANAKRWSDAAGFIATESEHTGIVMSKFETDVGTFLNSVEKMQQVQPLQTLVRLKECSWHLVVHVMSLVHPKGEDICVQGWDVCV